MGSEKKASNSDPPWWAPAAGAQKESSGGAKPWWASTNKKVSAQAGGPVVAEPRLNTQALPQQLPQKRSSLPNALGHCGCQIDRNFNYLANCHIWPPAVGAPKKPWNLIAPHIKQEK